jgi:hypothetical protein
MTIYLPIQYEQLKRIIKNIHIGIKKSNPMGINGFLDVFLLSTYHVRSGEVDPNNVNP